MPLDNNFQIKKEDAKAYPPLPKAIYQVELLDISLKDAKGKFAKEGDKVFAFQFTLLAGKEGEENLRGRNIWSNFVPTTLYVGKNGKNELYQIVEAFIKRELTQEEEAKGLIGTQLNGFIGKQIKIFNDHNLGKDNVIYNNITSYMSAETLINALTEEEKDQVKVKEIKGFKGELVQRTQPPVAPSDASVATKVESADSSNINNAQPVQGSLEAPAPEFEQAESKEEIKIEDIPF